MARLGLFRGRQVIGAGARGTWRAAQWLIDFGCSAQGARSQPRRADDVDRYPDRDLRLAVRRLGRVRAL